MEDSNNKKLFMLFLTIRFSISLVAGISSSGRELSFISYLFALFFLVSLILTYKNNKLGIYLFISIAIIEMILNFDNITNIEYLPSLLFWRVFGIYLAYKILPDMN